MVLGPKASKCGPYAFEIKLPGVIMKKKSPTGIMLLVLLVICQTLGDTNYTNPLFDHDFPDPCVFKDADRQYYVYATNSNGCNFPVLHSPDMVNWKLMGDALPHKPSWADKTSDFWAPDVHKANGKYYMFYGAMKNGNLGMCLGLAIATHPLGPFVDRGSPFLCGSQFTSIDPMVFTDPVSNRVYLYWGSDFAPLRVAEISADRSHLLSEPIEVIQPNKQWPYQSLVEASWIVKKDQYYYYFFSGDNCCGTTAHYAVMIARGLHPTGPFEYLANATHRPDNTILQANKKWNAPGHNSVIQDKAGDYWIFYHSYHAGKLNGRVLMMDKLIWDSQGWPGILTSSPSTDSVPAPVV